MFPVWRVACTLFLISFLGCPLLLNAQTSKSGNQTQGAVSTGAAHAAVLDTEKRPITVGGFVDSGPIVFQDIAQQQA